MLDFCQRQVSSHVCSIVSLDFQANFSNASDESAQKVGKSPLQRAKNLYFTGTLDAH
jgi:hypothetical protein